MLKHKSSGEFYLSIIQSTFYDQTSLHWKFNVCLMIQAQISKRVLR